MNYGMTSNGYGYVCILYIWEWMGVYIYMENR